MKKSIYLLICLISSLSLVLSSCMFNNEKKDTTKNIDNPNIDKAGPEVRILFYFNNWYDGVSRESGDSEIIEQLQRNIRENGFNIKLIPYYDYSTALARQKYSEVIKEMSASGAIDAFHIPSNFELREPENKLYKELEAIDLTDIFRKYAPILNKKLEALGVLKSSDKISFIPMCVTGRTEPGRNVIIMRDDIAKQLNINNIRTLFEYEEILQAIKSKTQYIPGYIQQMKYYDVMLEELGYYSIDSALGDGYGGRLFAYKIDDDDLLNLLPIEQIPGANTLFSRLYSLHQKDLLRYTGSEAFTDFSNAASFIIPEGNVVTTFDYENSRSFVLYPDQPSRKIMAIKYDKIYIVKNSKRADEIIKMLEWINSKTENMRLVRYGMQGIDYSVENKKVKILLESKNPENHDAVVRTYDYRFRFHFLLNSTADLTQDGNPRAAGKVSNSFLPLEKLILDNPDKEVSKIVNEVINEYKQKGQDIVKLINNRVNNCYKLFSYIPYNVNGFDILTKTQQFLNEAEIIREYYLEIIKRIKD